MRTRSIAQGVLCLLLMLTAGAAVAGDEWRQLQTPRFTVLSQLSDTDTRRWANQFDEFIDSVSGVLHLRLQALPPLTVILFDRDKDFAPYRPARPNGRSATAIAGFFQRMDTWSVIGLAERGEQDATRELIFHEALHWLTSGDTNPRPRWFDEGFAELFSTYRVKGDKLQFGLPIGDHILLLRERGLLPLKDFLEQRSSIFDRDDHIGRYYAQSWLFTHFLLMSNRPERREQLMRFIEAYRTRSAEESFAASFGGDYEGLQKELDDYLDEPRFYFTALPRQRRTAAEWNITPAAAGFVEVSLGKLAMGSVDGGLAARHAERARELDPSGPGPHELRAWLALRADDRDAAAAAARAALATGSRDAQMFLVVGDAMAGGNGDSRRRVGLYENAINLNPGALPAYLRLMQALQDVDPTEQDAGFLKLGRRAFPDAGMLEVGLAMVDRKRGDRAAALKRMQTALALQLEDDERRFAKDLRAGWEIEDLFEQGAVAMRANRLQEARAAYERILAIPDLEEAPRKAAQEMLAKLPVR